MQGLVSGDTIRTVHRVTTTQQIASGISTNIGFNFTLRSAITNTTERNGLTNLFMKYMITGVRFDFIPRGNTCRADETSAISMPLIYTAIDVTDSTSVAGGVQDIAQYRTVRYHRFPEKFSRYWKPRFNLDVDASFSGYNATGWIKTIDDQVKHYGLKLSCQSGGAPGAAPMYIDIIQTTYITWQGRQ